MSSRAPKKDLEDGLGDWRFDHVTTLVEDAGPYKAGAAVRLISAGRCRKHPYLTFVNPSISALCLNVAIEAAAKAEAIRPKIQLEPTRSPEGKPGSMVRDVDLPDLYYFFEHAIVAVTLSFLSLEAFANAVIGRRTKGKLRVKRKSGIAEDYTGGEAERFLSIDDKLAHALPTLLNVESPKGRKAWNHFTDLKRVRNDTVHIKSRSMYSNQFQATAPIHFEFLDTNIRSFPDMAIKVIGHYFARKSEPRWLTHAREIARRDTRVHVSVPSTL